MPSFYYLALPIGKVGPSEGLTPCSIRVYCLRLCLDPGRREVTSLERLVVAISTPLPAEALTSMRRSGMMRAFGLDMEELAS